MTKAQAALLVRRTAFGLKLNRVNSFTGQTPAAAVNAILRDSAPNSGSNPDSWVQGFQEGGSGIGDKMAMFWHNLIPISRIDLTKNYSNKIPGNLAILKRNAVGNYRALMKEIITDDGLILYLNGNLNVKGSPNENLARELMELFTIGAGHYSQRDVEQAALAMTGWGGGGTHNNNKTHVGQVTIFGETRPVGQANNQWNVFTLVDALLNRQQTADRISRKLWHYFVGGEDDPRFAPPSDLGSRWRTTDNYEVKPLLQRILLSEEFWARDYGRARNGLELYAALASITGLQAAGDRQLMRSLGMLPYEPPNVAGWPTRDSVWLSYGTDLRIAKSLFDINIQGNESSVDQTLARCGIFVADSRNKSVVASGDNPQERLRLAMISPEFRRQ
ncbi:MAG: DUF1800 family protein [Actinomycetota bacterium]